VAVSRNLHLYVAEVATEELLLKVPLAVQTTSEETEAFLAAPDVKKAYLKKYARDRERLKLAQRIVDLSDGKLTLEWVGW
jgi:hypothetical protein